MSRYVKLMPGLLVCILAAGLFTACTSSPKFSSVVNKDWNLVEVQIQPANITFDRSKLVSEGFPTIFTLRFDAKDERVNGVGAPNRYLAPYTTAAKQAITIKAVAVTMMAPLHEPEKLKEQDYFAYLQNTYRWNLVKEKLQLATKDENGKDIVLVFSPAGKGK